MTVDERRYIPVTYFVKKTHRKGRKERKAMQQESLRPLCSLWFITSSTPAHGRAPPQPAPAVYSRLSRGGMSMDGRRMAEIDASRIRKNLCDRRLNI